MRKSTCWLLLGLALTAKAQWSEGGLPPSFAETGQSLSARTVAEEGLLRVPVTFDVKQLKAEDAAALRADAPVRVGLTIACRADLAEAGLWTTLADGTRTCRLSLHAPGAVAVSLYYDRFRIPEGGRLYIYNASRSQVLGAYTAATHPAGGAFATEYVAGDLLTLEYVAGADGAVPEIVVSEVGYGYNHLTVRSSSSGELGSNALKPDIGYRASSDDMVDINCSPEGDRWQNEKRGVAKIVYRLANGQFYASGTLVNNTKEDGTMYWLTADHNFRGRVTDRTFADMVFYFDNERRVDDRNPTREPASLTIVGAEYLYGNHLQGGADVALLKITGKYEGDYDFFFNGWNVGDAPAASGVSIHHPKLDVKKISTFTAPAFDATWRSHEAIGLTDAHWGVRFVRTDNGFALTEKGSDGAPLFNQDGQVVGVLTGKNNGYTPTDTRTYYGKLSACWQVADPATGKTPADYLDPDGSGVTSLAGRYADGKTRADFAADRPASYLSETTAFTDYSYGAKAWAWSFPGAEPATSTAQHPTVRYTQAGTYPVTLTINPGTADEASVTKEAYISVTEKADTTLAPVVIGEGSATAAFPLGYGFKQSFDASLYTKEELGGNGVIYELGWQYAGETVAPQAVYIYMKETDDTSLTASTWAEATADATLVYQGADVPWHTAEGWCNFPLAAPFAYSGDKNLTVLVRTVAKQEPLASNACRYTEAEGRHLQWTSNRTTIPSAAGTPNANRPNLRVGFGRAVTVAAPVAGFEANPYTTVFSADFEGEDFFTAHGWTVSNDNPKSDVQWKQWTYQTSFTPIDPTSRHSAVCLRDGSGEVNSRMTSPLITLPGHCTLEFYAGYSGETTGLTFSVSTDKGATWTELWTPGRVLNSGLPTLWRKQTFDLSAYAGQDIQLSWHNRGKGVGAAAVDNVKICHPTAEKTVQINEGGRVWYEDRTAGPVVAREWSFPGGTPATSSESALWVQYDEAGTYDATLTVSNSQGEDAVTKTGVVTVTQQQPQTAFTGTAGYQRKLNGGRFIPAGAAMAFADLSTCHPRTWQWSFPGAETESSDGQHPAGIVYAEAGDYDVTLETANPQGGKDVLAVADYVRVGGTDSVWNMPAGDPGDKVYTNTAGYVTGTNRLMAGVANGYSERFDRPLKPCELVSVSVQFHVERRGANSIKVSVYDDEFGLPGRLLATAELPSADIVEGGYTTVCFERPVGISDAFHVAFENFNASFSTVDYAVAIKSSKKQEGGRGTAYMNYYRDNFDGWLPLSQEYEGYNLTLNVVPLLRYADLQVGATELVAETDGGNPQQVAVSGNVAWEAATDKMWIRLQDAAGTGDGAFTVVCGKNPGGERSGVVTVSCGDIVRRVLVRQAGAVPANLTAEVTDGSNVQLSWAAPDPAEAIEYVEDVENHKAFAVNSPGATGWSYIDGDGDVTFNLKDYRYANEGKPAAFMVFNPAATTPSAAALPGMAPHSGNQYFACFNAVNKNTDDWLVSPELNMGEDFKFSFYAKTFDAEFGEERIRVVYSTTGKAESDFTQVVSAGKYEEVPTQWTAYSYVVPGEAKYVAINCVSRQSFMLMVDDLYIGTEPEAPAGGATDETVIRHGSDVCMDGFGLDEGTTFEVAALYDSEELYACHGGTLTAVDFYPHRQADEEGTAAYLIKVYRGGELVHTQPVQDVKYNRYNRVTLTAPIAIDAAQPLMVGYEVQSAGLDYPAGYNVGPAAIGRGNLISTDGGYHFRPLTDLLELDVNWCIAAVITPAAAQPVQYNVYRNDANIGTANETAFTDESVADGTYAYHVSAVYGGNRESSPSNVCTVVIGESSVETAEAGELHIYPNVVSSGAAIRVVMETDGATARLRLTDLNGHECRVVSLTGATTIDAPVAAGMYILEVTASDGSSRTAKLIVK